MNHLSTCFRFGQSKSRTLRAPYPGMMKRKRGEHAVRRFWEHEHNSRREPNKDSPCKVNLCWVPCGCCAHAPKTFLQHAPRVSFSSFQGMARAAFEILIDRTESKCLNDSYE